MAMVDLYVNVQQQLGTHVTGSLHVKQNTCAFCVDLVTANLELD